MDNCSDLTFGLVSTDDPTVGGARNIIQVGPNQDRPDSKQNFFETLSYSSFLEIEASWLYVELESFCSCSLSRLAPHEAVQFDVDGTLCDSDPVHFDGLREMLQEIGSSDGAPITKEFYVEHFSGKHNTNIAAFGFPDDLEKGKIFMGDKEAMFRR
ncbi:hypothetical protein LguiB_028594 [Lonicera macranthoides]